MFCFRKDKGRSAGIAPVKMYMTLALPPCNFPLNLSSFYSTVDLILNNKECAGDVCLINFLLQTIDNGGEGLN